MVKSGRSRICFTNPAKSRSGRISQKQIRYSPNFCYPSLIRRPCSLCFLWNFAVKLTMRKIVSWGYPTVKTA